MKLECKRLFLSSLPENVGQADLEQKFSHYGTVTSVEIKKRKISGANQSLHFAYIQLEASEANLQKCTEEFSHKKWKGHWISIQIAKESFMERLKREREELKLNGILKASELNAVHDDDSCTRSSSVHANITHSTSGSNASVSSIPILPPDVTQWDDRNTATSTNSTNNNSSDSVSCSDKQERDIARNSRKSCKKEEHALGNSMSMKSKDDTVELVIKNRKGSTYKESMKIILEPTVSVKVENKQLGPKELEADKKRLHSIQKMKKEYNQQKAVIKNALANIDSRPNNKTVFDDYAEENKSLSSNKSKKNEKRKSQLQFENSNRLTLFKDGGASDQEEEYNFEVREQFEGRKGQKLMELQSRFKNDKRFVMDARFLEDQCDENVEGKNHDQVDKVYAEISYAEEKQKEFEILEQVLGKKIAHKPSNKDKNDRHKMMLRFDPSQPEHAKYEIKDPDTQEKTARKRKNSEREKRTQMAEETPMPEVSKDTFYKVDVDLKQTLQDKEGFSLATLFSSKVDIEEQKEEAKKKSRNTEKQQQSIVHEQNPFRFDSSDDGSDDEQGNKQAAEDIKKAHTSFASRRLLTESFFFKHDDYRLQEGIDFIQKLKIRERHNEAEFENVRRNLRDVMRAKVHNNLKKPFKRKLGGNKRLRVKRALKR